MDYPEVNIPASEVHTVRIQTAKHDLVLEKSDDGGWFITQPIEDEIEEPLIEGFLRRVADFDIQGVLTAEPTRYEEYGVTPELGRQVELTWDGGNVEFLLAGLGENYQEGYVRVGRDPRVFYLARRMPVNDLPDLWRDKRIVHLDPSGVESIEVRGSDRDYTIRRADKGGFSVEPGGPVDSVAVSRVVLLYSMFRTDGFAISKDGVDVEADDVRQDPDVTVVIRHDGGDVTTTVLWKELDEFYAVVRDDDDTVFLVTKPRINDVAPPLSRLRAD